MIDELGDLQLPAPVSAPQIARKASKLLMNNEKILACAEQTDMTRWWIWPADGVAVTTHRILFLQNGFFSFSFRDFHWEHVEDVHLAVKMGGADIVIEATISKKGMATQVAHAQTQRFALRGLVKSQAEEIYRLAQQMEHEWRETNRQRVMEENRVTRVGPMGSSSVAQNPIERLKQLKELHDAGVLSDAEYEEKKAVLVKLL